MEKSILDEELAKSKDFKLALPIFWDNAGKTINALDKMSHHSSKENGVNTFYLRDKILFDENLFAIQFVTENSGINLVCLHFSDSQTFIDNFIKHVAGNAFFAPKPNPDGDDKTYFFYHYKNLIFVLTFDEHRHNGDFWKVYISHNHIKGEIL